MVLLLLVWENYLLDFVDTYYYHKNTKQIKNERKWNKKNQACHNCHENP